MVKLSLLLKLHFPLETFDKVAGEFPLLLRVRLSLERFLLSSVFCLVDIEELVWIAPGFKKYEVNLD